MSLPWYGEFCEHRQMEGVNKIRDLEEKGEEDRVGKKGRFQQGD